MNTPNCTGCHIGGGDEKRTDKAISTHQLSRYPHATPDWEKEFDEEAKGCSTEQWATLLVASALTKGRERNLDDSSYITKKLVDKLEWAKIHGYREGLGTKKCTDCNYEGFPDDFEKPIFECAYCRFWFCPDDAEKHFKKEVSETITQSRLQYRQELENEIRNLKPHPDILPRTLIEDVLALLKD